ncbi:ABC transporter substrate-binding protein [Enterovirga sp.]|uniref:ABC transporter substrate-binding protein n=1 Tax=Enterovirga sp. TaxID=2026350 RepID=UPI00260E1CE8|nr:ABC transporter substrate-binding protein [Enterovirga sp.]
MLATILVLSAALGLSCANASETGIKIGVLNDQTGPLADVTGMGSVLAARMAVEEFGPTVNGKPIEIVFADHQNKPDIGAGIAARWVDTEKVDVIADVPNGSVALAVHHLMREKNRVYLTAGGFVPDISGKDCSPVTTQWTADTYALSVGTARGLVRQKLDTWFFITADYAFGNAMTRDASEAVTRSGGKVLGVVKHPFGNHDFSSLLLQAQSSGAKVIALANAGADTINALKQSREFRIGQADQRMAAMVLFITDAHALGLDTAQGIITTEPFYWDLNEETRAWSKRFMERNGGRAPTSIQASVYSSILHYLRAVQAAGTEDAKTVTDKMKATPVNDFFSKNVEVREDGRVMRDFHVFSVKKPADSKYPWDYYDLLTTIPAADAARPLSESECPLLKRK